MGLAAQAFDPELLRQLDLLALGIRRARPMRHGQLTIGRVQGTGIELENFRDYAEGDDLRFLDWNAMARLDSLLTRSYRIEREISVNIIVDGSGSMGQPAQDDKFGLAVGLAAALAFVALAENDPVRLLCFSEAKGMRRLESTGFYRRRESYPELRPFVMGLRCGGKPRLDEAAVAMLEQRMPPGLVIVISDFLTPAEHYRRALADLLAARYEVKVIQVSGAREAAMDLPTGVWRLRDAETGEMREVALTSESLRLCRSRYERMRSELRDYCASQAISYAHGSGADSLAHIMTRELPRLGLVR